MLRRSRQGFTLIEIVIVIAIIMIMTSVGIGLSSDLVPRYHTRSAAMHYSSLLQECRAIAIRTGRECSVWVFPGDSDLTDLSSNVGEYWVGLGDAARDSSSWDYLPEDAEEDGSDDDTSQGIVNLGDLTNDYYARHVAIDYTAGSLSGPSTGYTDRIVFDARGFVTNPVGDYDSTGHITVTFVNKVARSKGVVEDYTVSLSRAGMTRIDTSVNQTFTGLSAGTTHSSSP